MRSEILKAALKLKDDIGDNVYIMECDNSNFFSHGNERNAIIHDFNNELSIALRVSSNDNHKPYIASVLDFDQIQYIRFELSYEQINDFIENYASKYGVSEEDIELMKESFKPSKYYKRHSYTYTNKEDLKK